MAERKAEGEYTCQKPEGLLAHYTSAAVAFEHILPSGQLRMSPYRRMRDPAENKDIVPGTTWHGDPPQPRAGDRRVWRNG